ncbi:uncharacterized protein [Aphelocoma coerulescens]|uniref:uncharacterized protein n=1 Tax=Aphelocoma coerulescens TaxID=39617 RepID=UPI003604B8AA
MYELDGNKSLPWTNEATQAFDQLKKALMSAPALGLPDVSKPFLLFSHEKQGIALGILAQDLGPYRQAVAYLSKQLDAAAKGWPGCLRAVAAVAINIQEACKFTLGQKMTVLVSHTLSAGLEAKEGHWLSPQRFLKYQAILVEQDVEIVVTNIVNPASFLSGNLGEPVIHDCLETIKATYSNRPDLKDIPLKGAETWFTDGSSYVISGKRHAGYAVTTSREVIEAGPLPTNTSAPKAEIIALTRALELAKKKKINIYTDSRYAFGVVHAHGAIWKERGLLNSQGKSIKHAPEILKLLDMVQLPEKEAILHIKAHQKSFAEKTLELQWEGPFQVLLTTFTAIKIKEQKAWIHHSWVKKAPEGVWENDSPTEKIRFVGEELSTLNGKNVLVVEDIIETGRTMNALLSKIKDKKTKKRMVKVVRFSNATSVASILE